MRSDADSVPDNERRRRSACKIAEQTSHKSVKSGDMRGGFDTLHRLPPGRRRR